MSTALNANLRHLYQRRGVWLGHILLAIAAGLSVFVALGMRKPLQNQSEGLGLFIGLVATAFLVGLQASALQMEILTKSFSFCLPGHRQVARKFIFTIGVVGNMLGCLLFLAYPGVPVGYVPVLLASAFCAGLVFYFAGVLVTIGSGQPLAFMGFTFIVFMGGVVAKLHVLLERAIVEKPLAVILFGLAVAVGMWLYLGAEKLARRNCLRPFLGFGTAFNLEKIQRMQRANGSARYWRQLGDHPRPWVETWFLNRMNRPRSLSPARYVWGSLYTTCAIGVSRWKTVLVIAAIMAVFMGYTGATRGYTGSAIFIIPVIAVMQIRPSLFSTMPIAGGRDQRFLSTLATSVVSWLCVALVLGLVMLISVLLVMVLPDVYYHGVGFKYQAVGPRILWVLALMPLLYIIQVLFFRRPAAMILAFVAMISPFMVFNLVERQGGATPLGLEHMAVLTVVLWTLFAGILCHVARRRSLVR